MSGEQIGVQKLPLASQNPIKKALAVKGLAESPAHADVSQDRVVRVVTDEIVLVGQIAVDLEVPHCFHGG